MMSLIPSARRWSHRIALFAMAAVVSPQMARSDSAPLHVVATIKPLHALVAAVMGTTGSPDLLVGGTASPHTFVARPSDMQKVARADVVFRVAETVEPFTTKLIRGLPAATQVVTLIDAQGVQTLEQRKGGPFEPHEHHEGHDKHGGAHGHDDHDDDDGPIDGHIWLDPANAKAMVAAIAATLSAKRPELAAVYQANAAATTKRIDETTSEIAALLVPVAGRPYIVFHDAYQYFERRFGLTVAGSVTLNPDIPASAKRLSDLRAKITALHATCVFGEPNFGGKVLDTISEGTGAHVGQLDPEGATLTEGPGLYDALLRKLAADLRQCLMAG